MARNRPRVRKVLEDMNNRTVPGLTLVEMRRCIRMALYGKNWTRHTRNMEAPLNAAELQKLLGYIMPYIVYDIPYSELGKLLEVEYLRKQGDNPHSDDRSGHQENGDRFMDSGRSDEDLLSELRRELENEIGG